MSWRRSLLATGTMPARPSCWLWSPWLVATGRPSSSERFVVHRFLCSDKGETIYYNVECKYVLHTHMYEPLFTVHESCEWVQYLFAYRFAGRSRSCFRRRSVSTIHTHKGVLILMLDIPRQPTCMKLGTGGFYQPIQSYMCKQGSYMSFT